VEGGGWRVDFKLIGLSSKKRMISLNDSSKYNFYNEKTFIKDPIIVQGQNKPSTNHPPPTTHHQSPI